MKIYTFYEPITGVADGEAICEVWRENWKLFGWDPVVLGMAEARRHRRFGEVAMAGRALPTVNDLTYEMVNYVRHLAIPQPDGLLVDFDVLSNGFTPAHFHQLKRPYVPGFMVGGGGYCGDVDWLMDRLVEWRSGDKPIMMIDGKPHFSDQYLKLQVGVKVYHEACRFDDEDFHLQPVWHFNNRGLIARGYKPGDRLHIMRQHAKLIQMRHSLWTKSL